MLIIKIGGGKNINIEGIARDLTSLIDKMIIVHGANGVRDELAKKLGISLRKVTSLSGYSSILSNKDTIDLQMMAYAGLRNKRIVETCQRFGINAVGLSGIDGQLIQGVRNKGIKVMEHGKKKILRDYSGKPRSINTLLLKLLLNNGFTPVISIPIIDERNCAVNSENDEVVNVIHRHMSADKIIHLIEAPGLLSDPDDPESLIRKISLNELEKWESEASGRMKRKLLAIKRISIDKKAVILIGDGRGENPIRDTLAGKGTTIC